jgi:hypothetical protein
MEGEVRNKGLKRLCVFYYRAARWAGRTKIEWIVCKQCRRKINKTGKMPFITSMTEFCGVVGK